MQQLTKRIVDALEPGPTDRFSWCGEIKGFGCRVTPQGTKTFILSYRFPGGRSGVKKRYTIGKYGPITVDRARDIARIKRGEIASGIDPMAARQAERQEAELRRHAEKTTFAAVAENFIDRYAKRQNRSWSETDRIFRKLVTPVWGRFAIHEIKRSQVNELLDAIEDKNGPVMADRTLAAVRKLFNWHAARDETFNTPIVRGMARTKPRERARARILTDDEIRWLWGALDSLEEKDREKRAKVRRNKERESEHPQYTFGSLTRMALLTAQRREEIAQAKWDEFDEDSWVIPAARYKTKRENTVPLSKAAQTVLQRLNKNAGAYAFSSDGSTPFSGFSRAKLALDKEMEAIARKELGDAAVAEFQKAGRPVIERWVLHDLRRTARTLMTRAGVRPDIAERVLGHVISGVEGTYDRHDYTDEKRAALAALADQVDQILKGEKGKIVPLNAHARSRSQARVGMEV